MTDRDTTVSLCAQSLPDVQAGSDVPEWVHLLPVLNGVVQTRDRRGPYYAGDLEQIVAASFSLHDELMIDQDHAVDKEREAPARGWIVEMQARDDGIWGRVRWTPAGRELISSLAYRGLSPVLIHDKANRVLAIPRASLVNRPNLRGMAALNSEEDGAMPLNKRLAELLGLTDPTEDALFDAIEALHAAEADGDELTALQAQVDEIGTALGVEAGGDVLAAAKAVQAAGGDTATIIALQSELAGLATELNTLKEGNRRTAAEACVDGAIREARVGIKPQRDRFIALHMADPEGTEALIAGMPRLTPGTTSILPPEPADGQIALNSAQLEAARVLGISVDDYKATLKKERANQEIV